MSRDRGIVSILPIIFCLSFYLISSAYRHDCEQSGLTMEICYGIIPRVQGEWFFSGCLLTIFAFSLGVGLLVWTPVSTYFKQELEQATAGGLWKLMQRVSALLKRFLLVFGKQGVWGIILSTDWWERRQMGGGTQQSISALFWSGFYWLLNKEEVSQGRRFVASIREGC